VAQGKEIAEDDILSACEEILASPTFAKARRMSRLLRFLVDQAVSGGVRNTIEYAIGLEVFDRDPATYSPGDDPTVRVQVGRLRQRLDAYYAARAGGHGVEIRIPLGSYMPVIRHVTGEPPPGARHGSLAFQSIRCIAGSATGEAFACGLQEELLAQLFQAFSDVVMLPSTPSMGARRSVDDARPLHARHRVEGSIRIDSERIRTSMRLVEPALGRVAWARHFDRGVHFDISQQEELASSICSALKRHLDA